MATYPNYMLNKSKKTLIINLLISFGATKDRNIKNQSKTLIKKYYKFIFNLIKSHLHFAEIL
jgi:hypothetical protein